MKKILGCQVCRHDLRRDKRLSIDCREQVVDEDRLAGANFTGNDNEPFGVMKSVDEIRHCLPMHCAFEKEPRIWRELKRPRSEPVELGVHGCLERLAQLQNQLIDHNVAGPRRDAEAGALIRKTVEYGAG